VELMDFYNAIGENYDLLLSRLLSSDRIEKYLTIFFSENSIADLKNQIINNEFQSAINTAHTLKGVTATLGFDHLASDICGLHGVLKKMKVKKPAYYVSRSWKNMSVSISYGVIYIVKTEYYNNQPCKGETI